MVEGSTFRLKNRKAKRETVVWVDINHRGQRIKFYTNVSVKPEYWSHDKQRLTVPPREKDIDSSLEQFEDDVNSKLSDFESLIKSYPRHCIKNDTQETALGLKTYLARKKDGTDKQSPVVFLTDYLEQQYIPGCESW